MLRMLLLCGILAIAAAMFLSAALASGETARAAARIASQPRKEWPRIRGQVEQTGNPRMLTVVVTEGIEQTIKPEFERVPNERIFQVENTADFSDQGPIGLYIDPENRTHARTTPFAARPAVSASGSWFAHLCGVLYLLVAAAFWAVAFRRSEEQGAWTYFAEPPWRMPAEVVGTVEKTVAWVLLGGVGVCIALILRNGLDAGSPISSRLFWSTHLAFLGGILGLVVAERATYRVEAAADGLREVSVVRWKYTPMQSIQAVIDESTRFKQGARGTRDIIRSTQQFIFSGAEGNELTTLGSSVENRANIAAYIASRRKLSIQERTRSEN